MDNILYDTHGERPGGKKNLTTASILNINPPLKIKKDYLTSTRLLKDGR